MELPFVVSTLTRRGLLRPGSPARVLAQAGALRRWGFSLAGELRQAAARSPDRIALIDETRGEITYRELLERSERLARALHATSGIRVGNRVGLFCRNHAGMVEALVAITMLGADPVLANTGLSRPQLAAVAAEQQLRAIIYDADLGELLAGMPAAVERFSDTQLPDLIAQAPDGELRPPPHEGRTIVLTSGTTGTPKGARRRTPAGFGPLCAIIDRIPLHAGERVMIAAPIFHTWGYAGLQLALALRGTVVLQRRFDATAVLGALTRHRCTALIAVPVMLQRLLEVPPPDPRPPLRTVAVSGSALPGGLATRFMAVYGEVLYNLYGSTEASWASIATPEDLRRAPNTAGRPPHGTRVVIMGFDGRPAPSGQVGRIFVGNEMLFEGYTSGGAADVQDGLLGTGDLGHIDGDGLLFVAGRDDDMIVSGGENVFPSEVENLLADLPQVREVAVIGVPDAQYGQRLAAYLVLHPGETLDADAVREYVRRYRARFCVPREVIFLPHLPRNATGKVVTRALPLWW
ncbi:MAG TPA: AMP-binding protein [Catenuloplanes sp.]|jgi:acyl-CoA synthetase (AMP-forming)/AMP-acid ligase II